MSVYLSTAFGQSQGNHAAGDANSNSTIVLANLRNRFDPLRELQTDDAAGCWRRVSTSDLQSAVF